MSVFLFDELIFGPVRSRRLGVSLGINLLPTHKKICSFNCIYCECGWTHDRNLETSTLPEKDSFNSQLKGKLIALKGTDLEPDSITFAGNGEPTLHPHFAEIVSETIELRNLYAPKAKVTVLTNGSMLHKQKVFDSLQMVDYSMLKLDGGTEATIQAINMPLKAFKLDEYVKQLIRFNGKLIIQSLFLRGDHNGKHIDNTTETEVEAWLNLIKKINPGKVMVYAIERDTPASGLERVGKEELEKIAVRVRKEGIETEVFA
jgi:wyosine [tRNA(Phe)-imidazoG37] synthetase (radical SAM superfamily)